MATTVTKCQQSGECVFAFGLAQPKHTSQIYEICCLRFGLVFGLIRNCLLYKHIFMLQTMRIE